MIKLKLTWMLILSFALLLSIQEVFAQSVIPAENATGWNELQDANIIGAAFTAYDTPFRGWTIALLFIVFQFMILLKARNLTLAWVAGILFISLYATSPFFNITTSLISLQIIFVILAFELAGILYKIFFKG